MTTRTQQLIGTFTRPPNLENVGVGRLVMWAGLAAGGLPCCLLFVLALSQAAPVSTLAEYIALVLLYLGLLLLLDIPSRAAGWLWRHLWLYLLLVGLVCLAIQSLVGESFLQPIIFLVPMIYASLVYPGGRVVAVGLFFLLLMNIGIWLSGQHDQWVAFLFPTFGYGTFMIFTNAFVQVSIQQSDARREADRLAADIARQRDYLTQLVQITATLTRDLDLATVLEQVAGAGCTLARAARAQVWLRDDVGDDVGGRVQLAAAVPAQGALSASTTAALWGVGAIGELVAEASGARLVLPLIFKGTTIGALELSQSPSGSFSGNDIRLLQPFADAAAVAIENARLYEQSRLSATLSERNRLARELHDTIAQGLTAVTMQLEAAQRGFERDPARARTRIARAHELARATLEDVRRSVWTLAAPLIDGESLGAAIADLAAQFSARTGVPASYTHTGATPQLGHAAATQVLRIVQEALQNVEKHAQASAVAIGSASDDGGLRVWVRDDGVGFAPDTSAANGNGSGFGLLSLRERARLAGGTITVESTPGAGTRVTVMIAGDR